MYISRSMDSLKGTLAVLSFISVLWRNITSRKISILFFTSLMWTATVWSAPTQNRPLYLSYEKRLILTYLLAGAGESEEVQLQLASRLLKITSRYLQTRTTEVPVKSFDQFLRIYKGPWPNSYSIASDLSLLENESFRGAVAFRAVTADGTDNPALQGQIDGFVRSQNRDMVEMMKSNQTPITILNPMADYLLKNNDLNFKDKQGWVLLGFRKATEVLDKQFSMFESIGDQIASSDKLAKLDPPTRLFLQTVLKEYFTRMSPKYKKQMISRFLGLSLTSNTMDKFEVMLMSAGPQFQKLLQIVAGTSKIGEDLAVLFEKLQHEIDPIPASIVKKLFEAERDRYKWVSYELEPVGTGTMAQVHKGVIRTAQGDKEVVIRFLKPEIHLFVAEDARILEEIAEVVDGDQRFRDVGFPKLKPIVQDLNRTVADELILSATIKLQNQARSVYNRTMLMKMDGYKNYLKINVPYVIDGGEGSKLMVQELIVGRKMSAEILPFKEMLPKLGTVLVEKLATMWTEEVFFKSGVFHSDLHPGNFLVNLTDHEIVLAPLDFGMGGVLSKELQKQLVLFGIANEIGRPELIAKALWDASLSHTNQITEAIFTQKVAQRLEKIKKGLIRQKDSSEWMTWASDEGMRFPYELVSLNRGIEILDQALAGVGSHLTIADISEKLAPRMGKAMIWEHFKNGTIKRDDLIKLGLVVINGSANPSTPQKFPAPTTRAPLCAKAHY